MALKMKKKGFHFKTGRKGFKAIGIIENAVRCEPSCCPVCHMMSTEICTSVNVTS